MTKTLIEKLSDTHKKLIETSEIDLTHFCTLQLEHKLFSNKEECPFITLLTCLDQNLLLAYYHIANSLPKLREEYPQIATEIFNSYSDNIFYSHFDFMFTPNMKRCREFVGAIYEDYENNQSKDIFQLVNFENELKKERENYSADLLVDAVIGIEKVRFALETIRFAFQTYNKY